MQNNQTLNRLEYRREMKKILQCIISNDCDMVSRLNSFNNPCICECIEKKLIIGLSGSYNLKGQWVGSINNPKVTEAGYSYLVDDPLLRNKLSIIISAMALIVSISSLIISLAK